MTEQRGEPQRDGEATRHDESDRARRCRLLAAANAEELLPVADACIDPTDPPIPLEGPEVGTVVLTVREPVEATRFQLAAARAPGRSSPIRTAQPRTP
ncbi:MAG: hypothetical protein AAGK32_21120, partial [Actinomycetota bacterium]